MDGIFLYIRKTVQIPRQIVEHNASESGNALPGLSFLLSTRYEVFNSPTDAKEPPVWVVKYYIYTMRGVTRQSLLTFVGFVIAHLGVFAFLFEVFEDTGGVMKVCCYGQLGLLLLCFAFYLGTYLLDFLSYTMIAKTAREYLKVKKALPSAKRMRIMVFAVQYFNCSCDNNEFGFDIGGDEDIFSYVINIVFAILLLIVECLTIVYVYNNI